MAEEEADEVYCLCRRSYDPAEFMIECDVCKDWFHGSCVGIEEHQASDIDNYHCPNCQPEHGPLTLKRRRNWHRHDYSEINDGRKAIQSGTVMFVDKLKQRRFPNALEEAMPTLKGSEVTVSYFESNGFSRPILVPSKEGLGMKVPPPDFQVADVERCVGSMRELDVIDVSRQDDITMKLREWTEYYETSKPRKKVLNVISLEFTGTELAKLVTAPLVVRKMDWIERHWPDSLPEDSLLSRPLVQKYCLMGVENSYTDFHVDFGGTSVWYHVLRGEKVFYLIPPTEENLIRYEEWVMSSNQSEVFFGDKVSHCYVCTVKPGNTLFIPSGWIHAVLTPVDSLVFGGNFLHRFGVVMQLRIYEMEVRLDTPLKFRHPCYEALVWFAARDYLQEISDHHAKDTTPPYYLLAGVKEMIYCFSSWTRTKEKLKVHSPSIPHDIRPTRLIQQLERSVSTFEENQTHIQPVVDDWSREGGLNHGGRNRRKRLLDSKRGPGGDPALMRHNEKRRKSITMKLSKSGESKVIGHTDDQNRISMKLTVPQVKILSTSIAEEDSEIKREVHSSDEEGGLTIADGGLSSPNRSTSRFGRRRRPQLWRKGGSDSGEGSDSSEGGRGGGEEEQEYEDEDFVYPSLVNESEVVSPSETGPGNRTRKKSEKDDDDLWMPQGSVKLIKGSIASSPREKRNAKKRSFEHSLSATAAKILKMEQQRETVEEKKIHVQQVKPRLQPPPPPPKKPPPMDPVLGGGSLLVAGGSSEGVESGGVEGEEVNKKRATAAANAVNAVLSASRPKSKLLTPKQRLGKIIGLNKGYGGRWKT